MTTRELIEQLQAADPSGELPVVVGSHDIYFVETLPGYYDGAYQQLIHDPEKRHKQWSIVGARISTRGRKVKLHELSIRDVMVDMPDLPVEIDSNHDYASRVEQWRKEAREP